ncbi:hypothetical protein GGX14DRAFT_403716 [Mycena pura]|uniref:Uncharacterized protein n=1 Tax=Mycena pura TaxID=153505 RepID=A0AAD6Y0U0_9AGAR|nr:hypothetical protein GGX14DRAFT_403716 [Mycena pura]
MPVTTFMLIELSSLRSIESGIAYSFIILLVLCSFIPLIIKDTLSWEDIHNGLVYVLVLASGITPTLLLVRVAMGTSISDIQNSMLPQDREAARIRRFPGYSRPACRDLSKIRHRLRGQLSEDLGCFRGVACIDPGG